MTVHGIGLALAVAMVTSCAVSAQEPESRIAQDLKRLTIEELTQLDVTTASRRVEPLAEVAAAVLRLLRPYPEYRCLLRLPGGRRKAA